MVLVQLLNIGCNGSHITGSLTKKNVTKTLENDVKIKMAEVNTAYFKVKCELIVASAQKVVQEKESIISVRYG